MSAKQMSRSRAVLRMIAYTAALPIALIAVAVIYTLMFGING